MWHNCSVSECMRVSLVSESVLIYETTRPGRSQRAQWEIKRSGMKGGAIQWLPFSDESGIGLPKCPRELPAPPSLDGALSSLRQSPLWWHILTHVTQGLGQGTGRCHGGFISVSQQSFEYMFYHIQFSQNSVRSSYFCTITGLTLRK